MEKLFTRIKVADLIPYENNPRKIPREAVDDVKESYRQCGVIDPIEINEQNVILLGIQDGWQQLRWESMRSTACVWSV